MSDDLRDELRAAAAQDGGGSRPDVAGLWRAGRRRRAIRRTGPIAAVVVLLGAAAAGVVVASREGGETVRSGAAAMRCEPRSLTSPSESALTYVPQAPPATAEAMVQGGGPQHLVAPVVVARVRVLGTEEVPTPNERLVLPEPPPEVRARVEVVDPVLGAHSGDRLTISDAGRVAQRAALTSLRRPLVERIDDVQAEIDAMVQPLAELDAQILGTPPTDPGYAALVTRREALKRSVDDERSAATAELRELSERLQVVQLAERMGAGTPAGTTCHRFEAGDDLVVALVRPAGGGTFELTGPSSFFLVDGNGFSEQLDAARRSVPGWSDSELLRLARESTPDEFLDHLRDAADN